MKDNVRFTDTNAADDSKGRTWGLEGDLFWIVVGGGFAFVMILLVCFSALKLSFTMSLIIASVPLTLCLTYIFIFRQGKPAGYDLDCLDYWLNGAGFSPDFQSQPKHPLFKTNV
jgi:hypothetical protein